MPLRYYAQCRNAAPCIYRLRRRRLAGATQDQPKHTLSLSIRHLVVNIGPENGSSVNPKLFNKALKAIVYHLPDIHIFTVNIDLDVDAHPGDMSPLLQVLSSTCAPKVKFISFRGGAYPHIFYHSAVFDLFEAFSSLQILTISFPSSRYYNLEGNRELPVSHVSMNDVTLGLRALLDRLRVTTSLTHLSLQLFISPPKHSPRFETNTKSYPQITHLALYGFVDRSTGVVNFETLWFPSIRHLALSIEGGEVCTPAEMAALVKSVVALSGSALTSVRFLDEDFAPRVRRLEEQGADGEALHAVVSRLFQCTFAVEDWEGGELRHSLE